MGEYWERGRNREGGEGGYNQNICLRNPTSHLIGLWSFRKEDEDTLTCRPFQSCTRCKKPPNITPKTIAGSSLTARYQRGFFLCHFLFLGFLMMLSLVLASWMVNITCFVSVLLRANYYSGPWIYFFNHFSLEIITIWPRNFLKSCGGLGW